MYCYVYLGKYIACGILYTTIYVKGIVDALKRISLYKRDGYSTFSVTYFGILMRYFKHHLKLCGLQNQQENVPYI